MRPKRLNQILALLTLLATLFAPKEVERVRGELAEGTTPAYNAVHALFPSMELDDATPVRRDSPAAVPTVARSHVLEEIAYQACVGIAPSFALPVFDLLPLSAPPVSTRVPASEVIGGGSEIRGPPPRRVALAIPSLRAPPAA